MNCSHSVTKVAVFVAYKSFLITILNIVTRIFEAGPAGAQEERSQRGDPQRRPAAVASQGCEMVRADRMNRVGAFEAALMRMPRICALLLVCLAVPAHLAAQTEADRESVNAVVESLFATTGLNSAELPHSPGTWSLVIARFAKGDSREVAIPANAAEAYMVVGNTESLGTDVDICIYGPAGDQVTCDTLDDSVPVVSFTAETAGTYRAVMTAASVEGGGTSFAGMIVLRDVDEGDDGADGPAKDGGGSRK